jgi:urease accessory protein
VAFNAAAVPGAPVALGAPGAPGTGALQFTNVRGATVLTRAVAASPLKLLNPKNAGTSAWVYVATYGGGLVGGDTLSMHVEVGRGAAALLSTQASTKVYRSECGASQRLRARVDDDSLLVLLPDPVTCFAGSRYTQDQHIHLDAAANLALVDWLTAGRVGSGERWRFDEYRSQTRIWRDDRLVLHEGLALTPADGDLGSRMDRFNCLALTVLLGPALKTTAARLAGALGSAPVPRRADLLLSAAPLGDDGVVVRMAGVSVEQVGAALRQYLGVVPLLLGDDPWSCKL